MFVVMSFHTYTYVKGSGDVEIPSYTGFFTKEGFFRLVGEVKNNSPLNITNVKIKIKLFDSSNKLIRTKEQGTELTVLLSGRKSPFTFMVANKTEAALIKNYNVELIGYEQYVEEKPLELEIVWHAQGNISVYGRIDNTGSRNSTFTRVLATFYDENRKVSEVSSSQTIISLSPTDYYIFEIVFSQDIIKRAKWYSLTAESVEYTIKEEIESSFTASSENGNNPDIYSIFGILIGFSAIVLIIAILVARRKQKKIRHRKIRRHTLKISKAIKLTGRTL